MAGLSYYWWKTNEIDTHIINAMVGSEACSELAAVLPRSEIEIADWLDINPITP